METNILKTFNARDVHDKSLPPKILKKGYTMSQNAINAGV